MGTAVIPPSLEKDGFESGANSRGLRGYGPHHEGPRPTVNAAITPNPTALALHGTPDAELPPSLHQEEDGGRGHTRATPRISFTEPLARLPPTLERWPSGCNGTLYRTSAQGDAVGAGCLSFCGSGLAVTSGVV
ncbi:hypothetical protein GCM10010329_77820 [Streptomyces spiroverticillatus]|uniref:Uncharacterized protein n=1 Tax=Streptomyces finlayi TaxID=67296 RepID=A0A918X5A6_9ACTN|nr:hypothetical protein GCM10010329_77820 [Streptomyces spiroverticillatus]GHD13401.1 hypothetical protein GCM10010334_71530 [Streptomyces finlayi]